MKRILLPSTPSTNDYALELLRADRPEEGTIVQALRQTRGRGQGGSRWESEPGKNLTVSVILYPSFLPPRRQFQLSKAAALAVCDCLVAATPQLEPAIKWPNDVLLGARKVAGLLIENRLRAQRIDASVVGIGLNVNQSAFPSDLEGAGSLRLATGVEHDLEELLATLHASVLSRYRELERDPAATDADYLARLEGLGRELGLRAGGRSFRGTVEGVDEEGRLLVRGADGARAAYGVKEIGFDRPGGVA